MNKTIVVQFASEDIHFESQRVDCELANGVYSYTDAQSEHHIIFVLDVDVSNEMLEAMRQYYYHVLSDCDFMIVRSQLITNDEENQQLYVYRDQMLDRFFKSNVKEHKSLSDFDFETHKHLIDLYK